MEFDDDRTLLLSKGYDQPDYSTAIEGVTPDLESDAFFIMGV
jgi:hypothetical protein